MSESHEYHATRERGDVPRRPLFNGHVAISVDKKASRKEEEGFEMQESTRGVRQLYQKKKKPNAQNRDFT